MKLELTVHGLTRTQAGYLTAWADKQKLCTVRSYTKGASFYVGPHWVTTLDPVVDRAAERAAQQSFTTSFAPAFLKRVSEFL